MDQGLAALEAHVASDLTMLAYPDAAWLPTSLGGDPDVLIVGAGQGGLTIAANLLRERVSNILVIDAAREGEETIWRDFARMKTLRTAKTLTGPDLGIPSLTFQAWFEAQHGADAFAALGKIDKGQWQDYLAWIRRVLAIPVRNLQRLVRIVPDAAELTVEIAGPEGARVVRPRKLVLAMGIETSGAWWMPECIAALSPDRRAHASEPIDFGALAGRHVLVVGAGASAFDNAATALEAGARVTLVCRRSPIQRVQPYKVIANAGFLGAFGDLPDAMRWRISNHLLSIREAFPAETWARATSQAGFAIIEDAAILGARDTADGVVLETAAGPIAGDYVIAGTGFDVDLGRRPEFAGIAHAITTWGDRYTPPPGDENPRLARYPYLDDGMAFVPKGAGDPEWLGDIHCFNFGATASFGPSGSSISALKFAAPRLARAIVRDLFIADAEHHAANLMAYDTPEFDLVFARDAV